MTVHGDRDLEGNAPRVLAAERCCVQVLLSASRQPRDKPARFTGTSPPQEGPAPMDHGLHLLIDACQ
jgi:hypothetical protein